MFATELIHARVPDDGDSTLPTAAVADTGDPSAICERTCDVAIAVLERVIGAPVGTSC